MDAYQGLVIADDLTGAADTGDRFAARGYPTAVAMDEAFVPDGAAVRVHNTDSRAASPEVAARRVAAAVERYPADVLYKKVDSTLRGNLVAEIDAAIEAAGADFAVVAPAFPDTGRLTAGGMHLVHGIPVADTEAAADPTTPVTTSHLPSLLAGSRYPVEHLGLETVGGGSAAVRTALEALREEHAGPVVTVGDATRRPHLEAIAVGAAETDATVVYVGSAGLAEHVRLDRAGGGVVGIAGSTAAETRAALDALPPAQVVALDAALAVRDSEAAVRATADEAAATLAAEGRAVVASARDDDDVEAALAAGRETGIDVETIRDRVAAALGDVARDVYDRGAVTGLFATGGAVATETITALGGGGVRLTGTSVEAGVPIGRLAGGPADGLPIVTKAGAFGGRETILTCLDALATYHAN